MKVKWLLAAALVWTLLMAVAAAGIALLAHDTAATGQGPLNPGNLDSVRAVAAGTEQTALPFIAGLLLLAALLGYATRAAFREAGGDKVNA